MITSYYTKLISFLFFKITNYYPNNPCFAIKNFHFSNICANYENDFDYLITKAMGSSISDFFRQNNLVCYSNRP
jgi:hypothetical protein